VKTVENFSDYVGNKVSKKTSRNLP